MNLPELQPDPTPKEEILELAKSGFHNPHFFCKFFLPHVFPGPMPWVHWGMLSILTRKVNFLLECPDLDLIERWFTYDVTPGDPQTEVRKIFHVQRTSEGTPTAIFAEFSRNTEIMMPRGFSKTSIAGVAANLWAIVYEETKFLVYLSETAGHAEVQLRNIQREIESNERIRAVFGNLKPERTDSNRWTASFAETRNGITIAARGRGGQIRGLNVGSNRPDRIILDDVEDKESVNTEDQREKVRSWLYNDVLPAVAELNPNATITAIGTLLHRDALLQTLRNDPEWTCVRFGATTADGTLLWPEMMDKEKLQIRKHSFVIAGQLAGFYMEYFNEIRLGEEAKFKPSNIKVVPPPPRNEMIIGMAMDPAISPNRGADFAAIGVVGIDVRGFLNVLDIWMEKGPSPRKLIDQFFDMHQVWNPERAGIESIAYQAALVHLMREEMFRPNGLGQRRPQFEVIPITHSSQTKKVDRVEGILQARYANNYVRHARHFPEYEAQLLDWPSGKMDGPDVIAMAVGLLDSWAGFADFEKDGVIEGNEFEALPQHFGRFAV